MSARCVSMAHRLLTSNIKYAHTETRTQCTHTGRARTCSSREASGRTAGKSQPSASNRGAASRLQQCAQIRQEHAYTINVKHTAPNVQVFLLRTSGKPLRSYWWIFCGRRQKGEKNARGEQEGGQAPTDAAGYFLALAYARGAPALIPL